MGLLDSAAILTTDDRPGPTHKYLKSKSMTQPHGIIDLETAHKLGLPQSPYGGNELEGLNGGLIMPDEQMTVKWQMNQMKETRASVMAIHDIPRGYNCIIGYHGIKASGMWKNNPDVVKTQKDAPPSVSASNSDSRYERVEKQGVGSSNHLQEALNDDLLLL